MVMFVFFLFLNFDLPVKHNHLRASEPCKWSVWIDWLMMSRNSLFQLRTFSCHGLKWGARKVFSFPAWNSPRSLSLIVLPVRSSGLLRVNPPISPDQRGRSHTDLRWSTPNQTLAHRPTPPSWASNGSPGHPGASPAPTRTSSSARLITGSSRPRSPPFLSLGPAFWEHGGQMCPDEHVLICGPRLMLCQRPRRINSFISLKRQRGEIQFTGCF